MELAAKIISVTSLGVVELWLAIPVGIALKFHPLLNGFASGFGSIMGATLVIFFGDRFRNWLLKKKEKKQNGKGRIYKIWEKYGVVGLGLLSPLITGAPLGAAIGITLGAPPKRLLFWMSTGIVVWTIMLIIIGIYGFTVFGKLKA